MKDEGEGEASSDIEKFGDIMPRMRESETCRRWWWWWWRGHRDGVRVERGGRWPWEEERGDADKDDVDVLVGERSKVTGVSIDSFPWTKVQKAEIRKNEWKYFVHYLVNVKVENEDVKVENEDVKSSGEKGKKRKSDSSIEDQNDLEDRERPKEVRSN
ncbi:hypothetical protein LXL04_038227 [Taraxacum kok-saghyz]